MNLIWPISSKNTALNTMNTIGANILKTKLKAGAVSSCITIFICIYPTEMALAPIQLTIKNKAIANAKCVSAIYQLYPRNISQRVATIFSI